MTKHPNISEKQGCTRLSEWVACQQSCTPPQIYSYDITTEAAPLTPTEQTSTAINRLFEDLNQRLVIPSLKDKGGNHLGPVPECIITVHSSGRCAGFAAKARWSNHKGAYLDEIAIVYSEHKHGDLKAIASTLLHEMMHAKQFHHGKPGKGNYHNRQFSNWMKCCGLQTSKTGTPGGEEIGTGMSDYIIEGGIFEKVLDGLIEEGFCIPWEVIGASDTGHITGPEGSGETKPRDKSKMKFTCPVCKQNAWAKLTAKLACLNKNCEGPPMRLLQN